MQEARHGVRSFFLLTAALLAVLAAPTLWAQEADAHSEEAPPSELFIERMDVDVVNIEVYVTDKKGRPVLDLVPADFQIFEDGRPVALSNFYAVTPRAAAPPEEAPAAPQAVEAASEKPEAFEPPPAAERPLNVVLFFDDFNLSPPMRARVVRDLRPFVEKQLRPEDRVMVVSFDGSLRVVQSFTNDRTLVSAAVDRVVEEVSSSGAANHFERASILRSIAQVNLPTAVARSGDRQPPSDSGSIAVSQAASVFSEIQSYAQRHQNQTFVTLGALSALSESLSGLPGRKAVVYMSEGLSLRPGETLYRAWENKFLALRGEAAGTGLEQLLDMSSTVGGSTVELNVERAFQKMARQASDQGVTFYGLRPSTPFSSISAADVGSFDFGALDSPGGGQAYSAGLASIDNANRGGSMRLLADITGGFAITNAGTFNVALDRLRNDFDTYYSLGYTPQRPRDDKQHKIEVRLPGREDLEVRHRTRYRDRSRSEQMRQRTLAVLAYGTGANPLQVSVELAQTLPAEDPGHRRVPVLVKVPMANLSLLPQEEELVGLVSFHIGARDEAGRTSPIRSVSVPIRISKGELQQAAGRMAAHHFLLEMYPRDHEVTVGVRDEVADVESFTVVSARPEAE